jgi:hypothetical protein
VAALQRALLLPPLACTLTPPHPNPNPNPHLHPPPNPPPPPPHPPITPKKGINWGNGFITDSALIDSMAGQWYTKISDANPFFK